MRDREFGQLRRQQPHFANARSIRNALDRIRLRHATRLKGGLAAVTAAVVGVIANLSVWFALHVLFAQVETVEAGVARYSVPVWSSLDLRAAGLAALAFALLFVAKWNVLRTLGLCAGVGLIVGVL